jgi:hypothetical protein
MYLKKIILLIFYYRCEEVNETNNKKIKLNRSILKDNLEKRRLKLKVNL